MIGCFSQRYHMCPVFEFSSPVNVEYVWCRWPPPNTTWSTGKKDVPSVRVQGIRASFLYFTKFSTVLSKECQQIRSDSKSAWLCFYYGLFVLTSVSHFHCSVLTEQKLLTKSVKKFFSNKGEVFSPFCILNWLIMMILIVLIIIFVTYIALFL